MNIQQIMKQAQQIQKRIQESAAELKKREFTGEAGDGFVKVIIMGTGIVKKIFIDDSLINRDEKDLLEDLIMIAFNDARQKLDEASSDSMNDTTGGMDLKNMKLPF